MDNRTEEKEEAGTLKIIITMNEKRMVTVEGTIMDEIVTLGLIEKGKEVLKEHYKAQRARIVKPDKVFMPGVLLGRG